MLNVQDIANFLNTELDKIGKLQGYHFDIQAEVGSSKNDDAILGIVSTTKAVPKVDGNSSDYEFTIELSVPSSKTNENIIKIQEIIGKLKSKFHMKKRAFGGGNGTLMFTLAKPNNYEIKYVVADHVPVVFTISTTFVVGGVGSADKHWLLNGMEIPFINENLYVEKDGRTNAVNGKNYTKTLLTRQTRVYKFHFDYDNSELCIMLQKDLLDGRFDKVYTLTYYDGVSFTEEKPFTTSVSIFRDSGSGSTKPNIAEFDIKFTDVDNEFEGEYYMALIDNPFDSTTENTLYFETEEKQREYYQGKIDNDIRIGGVGCQFVRIKAPNLSSIDITNQVYEIPLNNGEPIYDVLSVTNKNYAIIKVKKGEEEQWFYYYVSNQNIGGQNQVMFDLKLDSVQTYYIGDKFQFGDCLIERGHENRWIDNGDGTVSFDGTVDSRLFEREDIQNVAKRLTKRTNVSLYPDTEIGNWFKDHVLAWLYLYLDPTHGFKGNYKSYANIDNIKVPNISNYSKKGGSLPSNIGVIAFPITLADLRLSVYHGDSSYSRPWAIPASASATYTPFYYFIANNEGYKYIYATKISAYPPVINWDVEYTINDYNKTLTIQTPKGIDDYFINNPLFPNFGINGLGGNSFLTDMTDQYGVVSIIGSQTNGIDLNYKVDKEFKFNKNEIINSNKNSKYNPKLLSSDYFNLRLSDHTENGFDYDLQKINKNEITIKYTEALVPDMAKKYIRIINLDGVYIPDTADNLTGFVDNNDNSIIMPTTAYQDMIANNKNFFLQNSVNRGMDIARSAPSIAQSIGTKDYVGAGMQTYNTALNYAQSKINENLTVDNLRNAPAQIIGAKGNPIFEHMYSETGVIVEEYDILPNEKEIINDYMCKYGFTVNRFGNPKDYDNIRHYYNYVKAQIDSISGIAISNQARDDIRQRFANGVRFWKPENMKEDNIDYSMENYEEILTKTPIKITNPNNLTYTIVINGVEYTQSESGIDEFYIDGNDAVIDIKYSSVDEYGYTISYNTGATYSQENYTNGIRTDRFILGNLLGFELEVTTK